MTTSDGDNLYIEDADYCGYVATNDIPEGSRVLSMSKPGYHTAHVLTVVEDEDIVFEEFLEPNTDPQPPMPEIAMDEPVIDLNNGMVTLTGHMYYTDCAGDQQGIYVHQGEEHLMGVDPVDSSFHQVIILAYGVNEIVLRSTNATGTVLSDKITVEYYPEWDFRVTLTWDTNNTDIDLHVWEPNLVDHCYWWVDFSTHLGLDIDILYGYGPENITPLTDTVPVGVYPVAVDYYYDHDDDYYVDQPTTCYVTLRLNPGTPFEEIVQFSHVLTFADTMDYYPVQYDTASWWRPCDVVALDNGLMTWQEPDLSLVLWE
jgi:uncharacterized protein YfaP (DUF2135 family)